MEQGVGLAQIQAIIDHASIIIDDYLREDELEWLKGELG